MTERELQKLCLDYLCRRGVRYSRTENGFMGRSLAHAKGNPDVTIFPGRGRVLFVEFKTLNGKLRPEQVEFAKWCEVADYDYKVVRDFDVFRDLIDNQLAFNAILRPL